LVRNSTAEDGIEVLEVDKSNEVVRVRVHDLDGMGDVELEASDKSNLTEDLDHRGLSTLEVPNDLFKKRTTEPNK